MPWRFTPIDCLAQKLQLAAGYGDSIINWGHFPFMDSLVTSQAEGEFTPTPTEAREAYQEYRAYYEYICPGEAATP